MRQIRAELQREAFINGNKCFVFCSVFDPAKCPAPEIQNKKAEGLYGTAVSRVEHHLN